jgi:outer membrane protein assembly factor BamB
MGARVWFRWIAACAAWGCISLAMAADWPQFGGTDEHNMVSTEQGLPETFDLGRRKANSEELDPESMRNVKWVAKIGTMTFSTPAIADGKIIIGSSDCDPLRAGDAKHRYNGVIFCFDAASGKRLWRLVVPWRKELMGSDDQNIGVASTATIEGKRAYIVSSRGEVLCLDVNGMSNGNDGPVKDEADYQSGESNFTPPSNDTGDSGDIVWRYDMLTELQVRPHISSNSCVLIRGELLYVATCNATDVEGKKAHSELSPSLVVLDKKTGALVATDDERISTQLNHGQYSSPTLARVNGKEQIVYAGGDGICYGFEADPVLLPGHTLKSLKKVWWFDCNPPEYRFKDGKPISYTSGVGPSEIIGTPVFSKNHIYVALGQDWTHAGGNGCFSCIDATKSGDVTVAGKIWMNKSIARSNSTAAAADGLVYIADQFGTLYCLDAESGEIVWTHRIKGNVCASPLVADGKVYIGSRDGGEFFVFAAGREKKVIGTIALRTPVYSTAVAANGVLYIATNTHLYAIAK